MWACIGGKYGERTIGTLLRAGLGRGGVDEAFKGVLEVDGKELSIEWHVAEMAGYRSVAETTKMPASFARPPITKANSGGGVNVSPELSPDGSRIMFFSTGRFRSSSASSPTAASPGAGGRRGTSPAAISQPVTSVGATARINLLGFAVAEIDYVRPLNRPQARLGLAGQFAARLLT